MRLDKWLWHARFFKSRSGASTYTAAGNVRVNGTRQTRSSARIRAGDTLTFALHGHVRVIEIIALSARASRLLKRARFTMTTNRRRTGQRRRPRQSPPSAARSGRPTKRERRAQDAFTDKAVFRANGLLPHDYVTYCVGAKVALDTSHVEPIENLDCR